MFWKHEKDVIFPELPPPSYIMKNTDRPSSKIPGK